MSTTMYSIVTGFSPKTVYMYTYTMDLGLGFLPLFYAITRRFSTLIPVHYVYSLWYCFLHSFPVFTASRLKEVYAYPMFFSIIPLIVRSFTRHSIVIRDYLLLLVLALGMVLSHYLATYMLIGSLFGVLYAFIIYYLKEKCFDHNSNGKDAISCLDHYMHFYGVLLCIRWCQFKA